MARGAAGAGREARARSAATAIALGIMMLAIAGQAAAVGPFPANQCAADRSGTDLNCTASDIKVAQVFVTNGVSACVAGQPVTLDLAVLLQGHAHRYNVGVFLARDGRPPIIRSSAGGSADCFVTGLPTSPAPLADLDANACGDFSADGAAMVSLGTVTIPCIADASGKLAVPAAVTWDNQAGNASSCQAPTSQWVFAAEKSKCNSNTALEIPVTVLGAMSVTKLTAPSGSPGSFAFTATGPGVSPGSFALTSGQTQNLTTGPLGPTAQTYTIQEQALAGYDPTARIACVDADGDANPRFIVPDPANRTVTLTMSSAGSAGIVSASCFFTNAAQGSINVVKNAVGGNGTFAFDGSQSFSIATAGGSGQHVLSGLSAGTYTVAEVVPPGWDLSSLSCSDPTGDTTTSGPTATVALAPGENVTCTFTDTARGTIRIAKQSTGGDGTFAFTGPGSRNFQITTRNGSAPPAVFADLPPGLYTVSEAVPAGWDLTGLACADPGNDSTTSGSTATVHLGAGETVTCTFTDTRRASIVVTKTALGGDAAFPFTGTQAFSITTTAGNGVDDTAFASVTAGAPVVIVESVPPGWSLTSAACRDTVTGSPVGTFAGSGVTVVPAAGQSIACAFVDTKLATLRVFKQSIPKSAQTFAFSATGLTPSTFALADDGSNPNFVTFPNLAPGDYSVVETPAAGWVLTDITCTDVVLSDPSRRSKVDRPHNQADARLNPGQALDCTFTNTQIQPGTLSIGKQAIGGDAAFGFVATGSGLPPGFTITTTGPGHAGSQQFTGLAAGTYTIAETVPSGWDIAVPVSCVVTDGSNSTITPTTNGVSIALGTTGTQTDSVACSFVDVKRGSLTIVKHATPPSAQPFTFTTASVPATTPLPATFQLIDSGSPPDSLTFPDLVTGHYTVTEGAVAGWTLTDISCTGSSTALSNPATGTVAVDLLPGDDVTCTYANAHDGGITITKVAVGGAGGETFAFVGDLSGSIAGGQSLSGTFAAGTYTFTEVVPASWDLTNIACAGGTVTYSGAGKNPTPGFEPGDTTVAITLATGQSASCTYTDTRRGSIVIVKNTLGGDGAFAFGGAAAFEIATSGGTGQDATTFAAVVPGTYAVTESVPPGWRLAALACSNGSGVDLASATATVSVSAGEAVTCTFTDARAGSITIVKRISGDVSGTFAFSVPASLDPAGSFTLTPPPHAATASRVFEDVVAGNYTIAETAMPPGWILTGIVCTGATASVNVITRTAALTLGNGDAAVCTFDDATLGTITIGVVSSGGTDTFAFDATGSGVAPFNLSTTVDGGKVSRAFAGLAPGSYVFTGLGAPGWTLFEVVCLSDANEVDWTISGAQVAIALPHGESIECTYYYSRTIPEPPPPEVTEIPTADRTMLGVLAIVLALLAVRRLPHRRPARKP